MRLKGIVYSGWIGIVCAVFLSLGSFTTQVQAQSWGYPGSDLESWAQSLYCFGTIVPCSAIIVPDRGTAMAAAVEFSNEFPVCWDYAVMTKEWWHSSHCYAEDGYCEPHVPACQYHEDGSPVISSCQKQEILIGSYSGRHYIEHAGDIHFYVYPRGSCTVNPLPPPEQRPDPLIPTEDPNKNLGAGMCPTMVGNPVNVATGNKYEPVTDLSISTPGIPLEFRRYYNSVLAADGPLGFGWTHSFSMRAQVVKTWTLSSVVTPVKVRIIDADGRALYFTKIFQAYTDGHHFYGESGVKDKLTINTSGQYLLRKKDSNLTYLFGTDGKLLSISDANGNTLTLTYTGSLLSQVTNNFGKTLTFGYTGSHIASITDPKGQTITYTYINNDLTKVAYPDTNSITYVYDASHRLTDKKDTSGNIIGHWDYNTEGKVSTYYRYLINGVPQERADFAYTPNATTLTRSTGATNYTTAIVDGINAVTATDGCGSTCGGNENKSYTYDSKVNLTDVTSISQGQSYTTHYTYDNPANFYDHRGEVTSITEAYGLPEARTTNYSYTHRTDDPFLLTQSTETKTSVATPGQNKVTTTVYNTEGKISSITESGYTLVSGVTTPKTYTTSYQYNAYGQLTQINGPRTDVNDITTYTYYANTSAQGNNRVQLQSITNALNQTTTYASYDANGNVGTITDTNGVITQIAYDTRNRIINTTNLSTGALTQYFYDNHGNLSYVIPPEDNRIDYTYNLADRITQISDTLGNKIQYAYDPEGNRTGEDILDPANTLKKYLDYTYDTFNRLKRIVSPDTTYTEYTYDAKGNRVAVRDPRTNTTTTSYDAFNRPYSTAQPLSTITDYGYDTHDNPTTVTDPKGNTTQYLFDDFGGKNKTISPDTGTTTYLYNEAGNVTQSTDANGIIINYVYDALNRVTSIQFPSVTTQNINYSYDSTTVTYGIGRLTGRIDPSGTYTFHYDAQGNMTREVKVVSGVTYTTQYGYNKNNVSTSITYPSGRVITYTMDTTGRVNQITTPIGGASKTLASSIGYLPFGAITSMIYGNNLSLTQDYDNQYRLSSIIVGSLLYLTYGYDENGNVKTILDATNPTGPAPLEISGTYTYEQGSNVLTSINGPLPVIYDSDLAGNTILENNRVYGYDALNRLITVTDNGMQIASYAYNAMNQRVSKTTSAGTKIFHYDLQGHLIAETNETGQTLAEYIYLGDQLLVMIRPSEQVYYYHNDHLGTPRVLTNSAGAVAWKAKYTPFGAATITTGTIENNIRFPGQYFDIETGLHYNWNRYYDPKTGRYITADPIGLEGGVNLFGYVGGNPVNSFDPEGLKRVSPFTYWPNLYNYAHAQRLLGHQQYPGEPNSSMRHCVVSCTVASGFGTAGARIAGMGNELQGLILMDIPDMWGRITGKNPWAFQLQDLSDNERGIKCANNNNQCGPINQSCIQCCLSRGGNSTPSGVPDMMGRYR